MFSINSSTCIQAVANVATFVQCCGYRSYCVIMFYFISVIQDGYASYTVVVSGYFGWN